MGYFTIVHILALVIFFVLLVLMLYLSMKEKNLKIKLGMIFSSILIVVSLSIFSMFVLDKYTKKAKIYNITHKRILQNESIMFKGKVKNVGSFEIPQCKLKVKMVSGIMGGNTLKGSDVFNPQSGIKDWLTNLGGEDEKKKKPTTIEKEFVVAKKLRPGRSKDFTVFFKYPPYFEKPYFKTEINCR